MNNSDISVLLLDDDRLVASSLARLLRNEGYDVTLCPDPQAALKFCDKMMFHLIITDQRMPVMNGTDFAQLVREKQAHARIVLITGYSDREKVDKAMACEAIQLTVTKPWDNDRFLEQLRQQVEISESLWTSLKNAHELPLEAYD
jgi:DNA-binding NtrC family response regulator